MIRIDWYGCYDGSWQSAPLVTEAYAHPAKVSFNLAERIYRHMLAEGWLSPGDAVLDPFGGVGGFAFHAALYGMHWTGVELEQKFVDLGGQNLELWRNRYAPHFPGYGSARLVQGDSRRLVEVVTGAGGVVSSPPYAENVSGMGGPIDFSKTKRDGDVSHQRHGMADYGFTYGSTPGQLGAMPAGVVSSPPYAANVSQGDAANDSEARRERKAAAGIDVSQAVNVGGPNSVLNRAQSYGHTDGNLGNMPAGVVTSPPFEAQQNGGGIAINGTPGQRGSNNSFAPAGYQHQGSTAGNIGNNTGDTFWSAAALIVAQCYAILKPGGYAAFVTGDFVRNKQRVPFGEQWLALCESVGFEPVLWATAWKAESHGAQLDIFGNGHEQGKTKVSFFRRLANQKSPDTAIVNEDVIFVRKAQP